MKSCAAVGVGFQVLSGAWLLSTTLAACGSDAVPAPKTAEAAPAVTVEAPSEPPKAEPAPAAEDSANAEPSAQPSPPPSKPAPPAKDPNAEREVKYVITPEGLKVEVAGVRFLASAEAKQIASGWGATIRIKAESLDGKEHVLLSPKNGPIAFAAAVFKKDSSEAERIPDARQGEGELTIGAGSPATFSRDFPNKNGRVLAIGETLDMQVGLWGLGDTKEDRRPLQQFVHVKMKVEKGKPKPIIEPPPSAKR